MWRFPILAFWRLPWWNGRGVCLLGWFNPLLCQWEIDSSHTYSKT